MVDTILNYMLLKMRLYGIYLQYFTVHALLKCKGPKSKIHKTVMECLSTKSFWKDFSSAKRQMVLKS